MADTDIEMQRALGRIEGALDQLLIEFRSLRGDFGEHKNDDQKNFSGMRALVYDQRREVNQRLDDQDKTREAHLREQDATLAALKEYQDRARGAGWVIISILGGFASLIGASVWAAIEGWIKIGGHP
ncbi:MAG: hypothetical protein ISS15_05265 [Alphaproteobacteria bacterium]|nr:hypothetical protein [Alphaproteobacteria bacterium]MBL6939471.1 hypothetical protein [Alphaproteobacteria bacterium]MBL7097048.1 hypothetical protein [Alphaproteobacteria bacterium]